MVHIIHFYIIYPSRTDLQIGLSRKLNILVREKSMDQKAEISSGLSIH
jgi:hypothetical protein